MEIVTQRSKPALAIAVKLVTIQRAKVFVLKFVPQMAVSVNLDTY